MNNIKLWTALITPMHNDGSIHFEDLEIVARLQEEAGNGILLIGSTGEGLALDNDEKKEVVDFVSGLKLNVPLMVGVGGFNLKAQKDWINYCNGLAVDAFLLVTPLYAKPGIVGQIQWFNALMDVSEKPCMIYNIPSRTGVKMYVDVLKEIKKHEKFWSVKEASGSITDYKEFRTSCPEVPLFSGDDLLTPSFAEFGCAGLVSVASNVWPMETNLYTENCLSGDTGTLLSSWKAPIEALFNAPNPIPAKVLLKEKGVISTSTLRAPLTANEVKSVEALLNADREIMNWYKSNK